MIKNLLLLLLFSLPMSVMAGGTLNDAEKAYNKAIKEYGAFRTCTLSIKNDKSDYVYDCLRNHHCVVVKEGGYGKNNVYIFLSYENRPTFERCMLALSFDVSYAGILFQTSQLTQRGSAYLFSEEPEPRFVEYTNILWTGAVKNGKLDGKGLAAVFVYNNDQFEKFFLVHAEFKEGMPYVFQRFEQIRKNEIGFYRTPEEYIRGREVFYYILNDTPGVVMVDSPKRGFGFYNKDLSPIVPFKLYANYDDFKDGYRRVVERDSENGTEVDKEYFFDYYGKKYTKAEMETAQSGKYVISENNSDNYSEIPEYQLTSDTQGWLPDLWKRWLGDGKISVIDFSRNTKTVFDDTDKIKSQMSPFLYPDDQEETFIAGNIRYFAYKNHEAQANHYYQNFHYLTGFGSGNESNTNGDLRIPSTVTNPNTGEKFTVTSIGTFANTNYRFVYIPKTIRQCGRPNSQGVLSDAFAGCTSLEGVVLEDGHPGINWGSGTFRNCSKLKDIPYNMSSATVNSKMFEGCTALRSIKVPVGVKALGSECFSGCTALDTLTIPNTITMVSSDAFKGISSVNVLYVPMDVYAGICKNKSISGNKVCLAANDIKIRDEKYKLCSLEENYLHQCELLEDYHKQLLSNIDSYQDVKLNEQLLDNFIAAFSQSNLDINNKVTLAQELKGEHNLINAIRSLDHGDYKDVIAWADKPSNIGFTPFHEKVRPVLAQKQANYNRIQKEIADRNADKAFKTLKQLVDAFGGGGSGSSSSSSSSQKSESVDVEKIKISDIEYELSKEVFETGGYRIRKFHTIEMWPKGKKEEAVKGRIYKHDDGTYYTDDDTGTSYSPYDSLENTILDEYAYKKYNKRRETGKK